jgi:colanic acid/amylovoran biosynthesis glycosyltransferase
MRIGYLAQVFPHLTMTFVYREVLALRAQGVEIQTFSIWRPQTDELSAEAKPLLDDTFYIFPLHWRCFFRSHLRYLLTRPRRYLATLLFCLTRPHKSWKNWLRTVLHFGQAIPLAAEVEQRQLLHLHVHFALNATTLALVVARLTGISFSFTAHANDIFANPILLAEKIAAARFIIAISEFNARFLQQIAPDHGAKIKVVRCGIDVADFAPPVHRPQTAKPTIVAVGRLVEKKGNPYLVQACKILAERGYNFVCLILGSGPQEQLLQQMIREHELGEHVRLLGAVRQEELKCYLSQADIITLPCVVAQDNDMDGIPNSLMEGMAMEIPAVSTTISGLPELIDPLQSGLLVPPNDATALADALALLLADAGLRQRLGQAGRRKIIADYDLAKNTRHLLTVLQTYLEPYGRAETQSVP